MPEHLRGRRRASAGREPPQDRRLRGQVIDARSTRLRRALHHCATGERIMGRVPLDHDLGRAQ
jgi:hypothetical protein